MGLSSLAGDGATGSCSASTGGGVCRFLVDRAVTIADTLRATALRIRAAVHKCDDTTWH